MFYCLGKILQDASLKKLNQFIWGVLGQILRHWYSKSKITKDNKNKDNKKQTPVKGDKERFY